MKLLTLCTPTSQPFEQTSWGFAWVGAKGICFRNNSVSVSGSVVEKIYSLRVLQLRAVKCYARRQGEGCYFMKLQDLRTPICQPFEQSTSGFKWVGVFF